MLTDRTRDPWTINLREASTFTSFADASTFLAEWEQRLYGSLKTHYPIYIRKL